VVNQPGLKGLPKGTPEPVHLMALRVRGGIAGHSHSTKLNYEPYANPEILTMDCGKREINPEYDHKDNKTPSSFA